MLPKMYFTIFFLITFTALGASVNSLKRFVLTIDENPKYYVPKSTYTVRIRGINKQEFDSFMLTVKSTNSSSSNSGWFYLTADDKHIQYSSLDVNTIEQKTKFPKKDIHVLWYAPSAGCVNFKAQVHCDKQSSICSENLEKEICELTDESTLRNSIEECCSCDAAIYSISFQGLWSQKTHPKNFPSVVQLTHFSDIIGCSHSRNLNIWTEGYFASEELRQIAEYGSVSLMESSLLEKKELLKSLFKINGLWYPKMNLNTTETFFQVNRNHNLFSLATMIGPSPDWFTGVSNLNLCTRNCSWVESFALDLPLYDAGTDSAVSYESPKTPTIPRERIHRITSSYPEDPRSPFYNVNKQTMEPVARIYITRKEILKKSCLDEGIKNNEISNVDSAADCVTTNYTDWSPCLVSCGKGLSVKTRKYLNPEAAKLNKCKKTLMLKKLCLANIPCPGDSKDDTALLLFDGNCKTTNWTAWSECSTTCGIGVMTRNRKFLKASSLKKCKHVSIYEKKKCMQPSCDSVVIQEKSTNCTTTEWTDWSPCSVSCGTGIQIRIRYLTVTGDLRIFCQNTIKLEERKQCNTGISCTVHKDIAQDVCNLPKEEGSCRSHLERWFYDSETKQCLKFVYTGCRGNRNNFITSDECVKSCNLQF